MILILVICIGVGYELMNILIPHVFLLSHDNDNEIDDDDDDT